MIRAVIFDLDGVIVKFNLDSRRIKEGVIRFFEENGFPKGILESDQPFSQIRDEVRECFTKEGKSTEDIDELIKRAETIPVWHEIRAAHETQLLPSVKETLEALKSMGLKLAVFTYNNAAAAEIALNKNEVRGFFEAVIARDMVSKPKPNPIHLEAVLDKLGVMRDEAIVVGDSEMDIRPSKELGVLIVAVSTGIRSIEELKACNPDYMISQLPDLMEIVTSLR